MSFAAILQHSARPLLGAATAVAGLGVCAAHAATDVALCTDEGRIVIELADERAPLHAANFLAYVDSGFYSGTVFHRVVPGFVIQGGGVDRALTDRATLPPVQNESGNGLRNVRGALSAARTRDLDSATSQFFINLVDNPSLDEGAYTVYGRVTEGLDVVDRIAALPTGAQGRFSREVPMPPPAIRSAARLDRSALADLDALGMDERAAALAERARAASANTDQPRTLEAVTQYRAVCGAPTAEIALLEARAALATGAAQRARSALDELLAVIDETDPAYANAHALRSDLDGNISGNLGGAPDAGLGAGLGRSRSDGVPAAQLGACAAPAAPEVPRGATANEREMEAARAAMMRFFAVADVYAACLAELADDGTRPAVERSAASAERERALGEKELLIASFNAELVAFRRRR